MELSEARNQVIEAGKRLLHSGLIARTWGNVSCRINENQFVITPSGRSYENLKPEEIVIVNIPTAVPGATFCRLRKAVCTERSIVCGRKLILSSTLTNRKHL